MTNTEKTNAFVQQYAAMGRLSFDKTERLYNLAETRKWLCSEQAGFRKLFSCEDQTLRITQTISNGFRAAKPQRSLMAHLDFSKAFDRVWREETPA